MNKIDPALHELLPLPTLQHAGMRLERCEVLNWGTFHNRVWALDLRRDNALLTGDIGSGKSTLVDAITTLLVPAQKISYNKAAGAETRERDLRSYVLGYYKSERGDPGLSARPVALRDHNSYSVILGRFRNDGFDQDVTLAQVFSFKERGGQPSRFYVVADACLSITEHFTGFGSDINALRKKLRALEGVELFDSFPPYGAAFRRRFGIDNEQALELFHQTVSMKSIGNLTEFVQQHMLEAFPADERIGALIAHFDDLRGAHEAVLKAKAQIEFLVPLVGDCDQHQKLSDDIRTLRSCRDALRPYFAHLKTGLLASQLELLAADLAKLALRVTSLNQTEIELRAQRDDIKRAIAENGGDRLDNLKKEIAAKEVQKAERMVRSEKYAALARDAELPMADGPESFLANRHVLASQKETALNRQTELQNSVTEKSVTMTRLKEEHSGLNREIDSLKTRRSNVPAHMLAIRERLCGALRIDQSDIPFAGELIEVREDQRAWEGAAERLLHGYALSLLVPDESYPRVAEWVDRTHLAGRLVYFRVRERRAAGSLNLHPLSLVRKLAVKPDSQFYDWLESDLAKRFDYACCDSLDSFRREDRAITLNGQVKTGAERHEKDDRYSLHDRTQFVLGWSNEAKIAALEDKAHELERRMQAVGGEIAQLKALEKSLANRLETLGKISVFENFQDIDWRPLALDIERLRQELRDLEEASDTLKVLGSQLNEVELRIEGVNFDLTKVRGEQARKEERRETATRLIEECRSQLTSLPDLDKERYFPRLDEFCGSQKDQITLASCDGLERDSRERLQQEIDREEHRIARLRDKIIQAMTSYRGMYPLETQEADASPDAAPAYRAMLQQLQSDGLPGFERRFKELLNENTIREIANFQSQLSRERQSIRERIEKINQSLHAIDYNPGRFIRLEAGQSVDAEIRDFQQDLRACTEGALTGSEDDEYSEAKFLQVKAIIERFRGREGQTDSDGRWTRKVTDVRNWFVFSASERWREDDREHEHYTDSGGKSGGQKEKLAYTVLAASLAYQFGLEWGETQSRTFRFVLIDEAFGRGSDESTRYGLELFRRLSLQLLIVTPLQKIHVIEPYVAAVGFVHADDGQRSMLRNLTIDEYRAECDARGG
jgi:uncharacterized protein YPO0396